MDGGGGAIETLFVYGSLCPGASDFWRVAEGVLEHAPAYAAGELVRRGAYPALVTGDGWVAGSLLMLTPGALAAADQWEGYVPGRARNLYERRRITAYRGGGRPVGGQPVDAWAYFLGDEGAATGAERLVIGAHQGKQLYAWRLSGGP